MAEIKVIFKGTLYGLIGSNHRILRLRSDIARVFLLMNTDIKFHN